MPTTHAESNNGSVMQTTLATLAAALQRHLDYYSTQGVPVEHMDVVLAIRGENRLESWSLQWPEASEDAPPP